MVAPLREHIDSNSTEEDTIPSPLFPTTLRIGPRVQGLNSKTSWRAASLCRRALKIVVLTCLQKDEDGLSALTEF